MKRNLFKTMFIVFVMSLSTNSLFAQGAYINANVGYGFIMGSQTLYNYSTVNSPTSGNITSTIEAVNISLGEGFNFGAGFGYMFNKHIGTELGISYLLGNKSKSNYSYLGTSFNHTSEQTVSSKMLRFIPSLVIASGFEKINLYAKFGLVIGSGSVLVDDGDIDDGESTTTKTKLNGGVVLGLSSGIGAIFNLSENVALFTELNMINMSYAPTKGEVIESTLNGVNDLSSYTTKEKKTEFVDSYTSSYNNPTPETLPSQGLKEKLPFGSFGINVGCRINL